MSTGTTKAPCPAARYRDHLVSRVRIGGRCCCTFREKERTFVAWRTIPRLNGPKRPGIPRPGAPRFLLVCDRCYAERIALRFPKTFPNGFAPSVRPDALTLPLHWRRPRTIFVNSMSDLFHVDVPDAYIATVFDVMVRTPQHTYQVLTKRAERLGRLAARLPWPSNVWMGVSVETPKYSWRIDYLRRTNAAVRFISAEPLLAALPALNLEGIHWLIAGGESQPGARPAQTAWFEDLRDQCSRAGVAFFLKQLGGHLSKRGGEKAVLDGRRWVELPVKIQPTLAPS